METAKKIERIWSDFAAAQATQKSIEQQVEEWKKKLDLPGERVRNDTRRLLTHFGPIGG